MRDELQALIDTELKELFQTYELTLLESMAEENLAINTYHHQHLVLQILLERGHAQLLVGSVVSRRDMWPVPMLQDTFHPQEEMRQLPPLGDQARGLLDIWDTVFPRMSPESFPETRQRVHQLIRQRSETMFNFTDLNRI